MKIQNYIDGKFCDASSGGTIPVFDPSRGIEYATAPDSDQPEVEAAYRAAESAFPAWSQTPVKERSRLLNSIAERIDAQLQELAEAESRDNGKPVRLARKVDIPRASDNFRFFANAILQFSSDYHEMDDLAINYTIRSPLGVVACISPWNLPLYLFSWKIAPALAAGNTVVAKPSEITPLTAFLLSRICDDAGLPKGVLNIIHGLGSKVGNAISEHPGIKAISFTGSTATGTIIATKTAAQFKKLSLEMGGKNPNIIFADCDYERMLKQTVHSSFSNQGQICLCGSRIFVEKSIYERFKSDFVEKVRTLKIGDPRSKDSQIGAVVSEDHMNKILGYVDLAKKEGGRILTGGKRFLTEGEHKDGWFVEPTIIEGLSHDCRTNQEEIFGPVVSLMPFETEDEVLLYANSTQYGLSATIWTQDLTRAHQLARKIEAGIVWINTWLLRDLRTPFGGMKNSGVGREGGYEALRFFTEPKNVCIQIK